MPKLSGARVRWLLPEWLPFQDGPDHGSPPTVRERVSGWRGTTEAMVKFVLEVDVPSGDVAGELGRILRHWANNLSHYPLGPGSGAPIFDSSSCEVGRWHIVGGALAEDAVDEAFDDFEAYANGTEDEETAAESMETADAEQTDGYDSWQYGPEGVGPDEVGPER